jgi:hypothetical protein
MALGSITPIHWTPLYSSTASRTALITSRGKKEVPGRPTLWGTTPRFLEQFGLKSLADLPRREDLVSNDAALPLIPASAPEQGE